MNKASNLQEGVNIMNLAPNLFKIPHLCQHVCLGANTTLIQLQKCQREAIQNLKPANDHKTDMETSE